ncbi:hypothetical protein OC842_007991, partial [Tilletia horrida]
RRQLPQPDVGRPRSCARPDPRGGAAIGRCALAQEQRLGAVECGAAQAAAGPVGFAWAALGGGGDGGCAGCGWIGGAADAGQKTEGDGYGGWIGCYGGGGGGSSSSGGRVWFRSAARV